MIWFAFARLVRVLCLWLATLLLAVALAAAAQGGLSADEPNVARRYAHLLLAAAQGDFGVSAHRGADVADLLSEAVPATEILVCDEPTFGLDPGEQVQSLDLLRRTQARLGFAMLFATGDPAVARAVGDLVAVLLGGRLLEFGATEAVFRRPRHPYTRRLRSPSPDLPDPTVSGTFSGTVSGCLFRARCSLATERCVRHTPELLFADGVAVACHAVEEGRA
jgi:oligopeptide/dipeptide ABC transporter ATP-binding protein